MTPYSSGRRTLFARNGRLFLLLCVLVVALGGTIGAQVGTAHAASGPPLGAAASFAVLGGTTVGNTGATNINGDVGVSPGTSITGFPPGVVTGGALHAGDATATQAEADLATAYAVLAGEAVDTSLSGQDLGGLTLTPGVYNFAGIAQLNGTLTLDAQGAPNAVFVIQIGSVLTTGTNASVMLINSAHATNVFWQVGSSATVGMGTAFQGSILAFTSITVNSGANMDQGRALAINGAVTLDTDTLGMPGPTPLTITADNQSTVYGAALPALTATYTGFINGDTAASLTTPPTCSTTATSSSPVGSYAITCVNAVDPDYTISYVSGNLTITSAPLTITADNQSKVYGAALPTLTASYSGLVNGDTSASLTTQPTLTTTATAGSPVAGNPYAITASGTVDTNYTISYVAGALTVTPAPLTVTADNQAMLYGAAVPFLSFFESGLVNGDTEGSLNPVPTITTTATSASPAGAYPITVSGAVDTNYTISYVAGTLTVGSPPVTNPPPVQKITPTISWINPAAITFGTALSATQLNAVASVPGTLTYSSPAGSVLGVGTQFLTVLFTPFDTVDYNAASALVSITVLAAPPVIAPIVPVVATSTPIPLPTTIPVVVIPATATVAISTATPTVPVTLVIHNNARTEIGGRTQACDLAKNTNGAKQRGCEIVSSVSAPGATVTYTLTYQDGSSQQFTDIADSRGHSLHAFNVAYRPAASQAVRSVAHIMVVTMLVGGAMLNPVHVRFAVMR